MLGYIAAGIGIAMVGKTIWMVDDWGRDFSSNQAELSDASQDESLRPIRTKQSASEVENAVRNWVESQSHWNVVADSEQVADDDSLGLLHLTRTTPVFRFVDDIHVRISEQTDPQQTVLTAKSQSRIGKGDLGQNPRNLRMLREGILSALP
jgi:uncharacterized protein (DUF1499 family)